MELFSRAMVRIPEADLQRFIDTINLPEWCASIHQVVSTHGSRGEVRTVWGEVMVHRELVNGGVRFTCPNDPHALQWTLTASPAHPSEVLVHLTVNRETLPSEVQHQLEIFITDWRAGLEEWPQRRAAKLNKPCVNCADSFGGFG